MGVTVRSISRHLRRFLIEKFGNKCVVCGWNKNHPITHTIPLEIDHIDGNSENNLEKNLQLLCPNCHALTPFFKNLNKGKGRKWRIRKYIKNT
jgi:5-methylcytosine-specific restriction endonuclease McrA